MARILGSHTSDEGGIHMAVRRAANAGMNALQLFTAIPKFYGDKSSINPDRVRTTSSGRARRPVLRRSWSDRRRWAWVPPASIRVRPAMATCVPRSGVWRRP
jgi:endonuclease IV